MKIKTLVIYAGWACGILGALLMLAGVIGYFTNGEFLSVRNYFNFFFLADSFIILGIFCVLAGRCRCGCKDDAKKE